MERIALGLRSSLGLIFLVAGGAKVATRGRFVRALVAYSLIPRRAVSPVARSLPLLEITTGALLLTGIASTGAAIAAAAMLAVFAAGMAVNLVRGRRFDCGCAGLSGSRPISWSLVGRNLLLAGGAAWIAVIERIGAPPSSGVPGTTESLPVIMASWTTTILVALLAETARAMRRLVRLIGGRS